VFMSHDWGLESEGYPNHKRVIRIDEELRKRGLRTWLDVDQMSGDIRNRMTEGIDNTKCFLAFITDNYYNKVNNKDNRDSCRFEFNYAFTHKGGTNMLAVMGRSEDYAALDRAARRCPGRGSLLRPLDAGLR
jgi:hypothetical protein